MLSTARAFACVVLVLAATQCAAAAVETSASCRKANDLDDVAKVCR